jgi:rRNA-processing protein FCF1
MPFQFKLNLDSELSRLFGEYELIIPGCVLSELRGLERHEKFGGAALKLALSKAQPQWYIDFEQDTLNQLLKSAKDETVNDSERTDNMIIRIADELSASVVTNDKTLLARLKERKIQTISLRSRKYLRIN